ncbi:MULTISPECIES: FAD/NAD(P)-binding oxidoreductase [unclassified Sulfuricurvum]|uniref:NAD(P)/FAD-dependent oxidoreductase n=1 Tax=unclassified Sulfuricurvum TaxID=2632390 RepID=UPI0002999BC8|nr:MULTISPECIES: FAD/NAD(P)-binding oxidoreductase [unclassified Sulfuricurvum]AFV98208.1 fad-dependent pyridine nucleotide-disulfide oxidoreductase [Candidatus Sulfuricurvum sp. RIFRC-1]OHD84912.1 MAG: pyridine nucleotide-disulfide oxidoreductase [Sulfuricurvum sp. RIFCSPHIGHO2_02_FULL_43_9]OHD88695.1 MAG: pyridine nucleotide-disulfide oxidoreductase [Sulfuricurvum sp. RIFCSPLOWO2_12_FULL_43_24]HBM34738.1 NAD(P)/FAD-dependent oxidoreductase [Sulfuricurvum sp.]
MSPEEIMKKIEAHKGLSRRDALKMMALSPVAASVLAGSAVATPVHASASDAVGKIVIVGGGSGALMTLSRLRRALSKPDITIIAPNEKHVYQPGQIFVAAGEYEPEDIIFDNTGYIGDDVTWIKDEVATFDPDNNKLTTKTGTIVDYDYLVVAAGVQYHYEQIEGLSVDMLGKHGIASVYQSDLAAGTAEGATITRDWFKALHEAAKTSKPRVICTQPSTPLKCGGAPQKILYLSDDYLKRDNLDADFIFATAGEKLFSLPEIDAAIQKVQKGYGNITNKFGHELIRIDAEKKVATFHHTYQVQGEYDKEFEEYEMIDKEEEVTLEYDFIHISPPTAAVDAVANSLLGWQKGTAKGWLEVDRETLQHRRYKNVFGIGDVCGIPVGKTGGSARHQGPIVVGNLISVMEKKEPSLKFDGYTVCPLKTSYGEIIMAEFNYDGLAPSFPLDPAKPRWVWWVFDLYMLQPMYRYLMLNGLM